ncbi:DUF4314 domain-containing protein, partial [Flavonifractor plautii]
FPAGSRIQTWELDDPRNTLKEAGTLEHIDDEGRFHARQSDGGERILTLGEEMFSVHPPEPSLLKLYMPMTVGFYEPDGWGNWDERERFLDSQEAAGYADAIAGALHRAELPEEEARGLMHYYDREDGVNRKVLSCRFTAEARDGRLWGVAECLVSGSLTEEELTTLKEMAAGQASDGFGEGFEQRPIDAGGRELFAHLWQCENWEIQTEQEWFGQTQAQESHDNGAPAEAQRSGFGGERSSGEMSEHCPQGEARDMKHGTTMTMGGMSRG